MVLGNASTVVCMKELYTGIVEDILKWKDGLNILSHLSENKETNTEIIILIDSDTDDSYFFILEDGKLFYIEHKYSDRVNLDLGRAIRVNPGKFSIYAMLNQLVTLRKQANAERIDVKISELVLTIDGMGVETGRFVKEIVIDDNYTILGKPTNDEVLGYLELYRERRTEVC